MSAEGDAERQGREMGLQVTQRPLAEQAAWLRGVAAVLGPVFPRNGLAEPPDGAVWAEAGNHALTGSVGLAHLIPADAWGAERPDGHLAARCGMVEGTWLTVGRWESTPRQACPSCAGATVRA